MRITTGANLPHGGTMVPSDEQDTENSRTAQVYANRDFCPGCGCPSNGELVQLCPLGGPFVWVGDHWEEGDTL